QHAGEGVGQPSGPQHALAGTLRGQALEGDEDRRREQRGFQRIEQKRLKHHVAFGSVEPYPRSLGTQRPLRTQRNHLNKCSLRPLLSLRSTAQPAYPLPWPDRRAQNRGRWNSRENPCGEFARRLQLWRSRTKPSATAQNRLTDGGD